MHHFVFTYCDLLDLIELYNYPITCVYMYRFDEFTTQLLARSLLLVRAHTLACDAIEATAGGHGRRRQLCLNE